MHTELIRHKIELALRLLETAQGTAHKRKEKIEDAVTTLRSALDEMKSEPVERLDALDDQDDDQERLDWLEELVGQGPLSHAARAYYLGDDDQDDDQDDDGEGDEE